MAMFWFKTGQLLGGLAVRATCTRIQPSVDLLSVCGSQRCFAKGSMVSPSWMDQLKPPKRPVNSFLHFCQDKRPQVTQENPGLRVTDYTKIIRNMWIELSVEDKQIYAKQYVQDFELYKRKYQEFTVGLTSEQKAEIAMMNQEKKLKRSKTRHKKLLKSLGKPKQARTAHQYYIIDTCSGKSMNMQTVIREVSENWRSLSPAEKEVYEEKSKQDKIRYMEENEKWKQQILAEGQLDEINKSAKRVAKEVKDTKSKK